MTLIPFLLAIPIANAMPAADWMSGEWGVGWRFRADNKTEIANWNVTTLVTEVKSIPGVHYVVFNLSDAAHGDAYIAPHSVLTAITPSATPNNDRDLFMEMATAFQAEGIKVIAYIAAQGPAMLKHGAESAFDAVETSPGSGVWTSQAMDNWAAYVLTEYGNTTDATYKQAFAEVIVDEYAARYGTLIDGWWFDNGDDNYDAALVYSIAKQHNPNVAVGTNSELSLNTDFLNGHPTPLAQYPANDLINLPMLTAIEATPAGYQYIDTQPNLGHMFMAVGEKWNSGAIVWPLDQAADWMTRCLNAGGAWTWNVDLTDASSIIRADMATFLTDVNAERAANLASNLAAPIFSQATYDGGNATFGVAYTGSLAGSATDADGDALTYAKASGLDWLTVAADGTLSGTPDGNFGGGINQFTLVVADGKGLIDLAELEIMVEPPPQTWTGNAVADNLWGTAGNWSLGTLPEAGQTLEISNGDVIDVSSAADFPSLSTISLLNGELSIGAAAHLDLQSGSILTVDGGSITRDYAVNGENINIGISGDDSTLDISSGSIQFTNGANNDATIFYSDLTIRGGDIDIDSQTRIYGELTIRGSAATIDCARFKGFSGSTIHFVLDETGVSPINVEVWANVLDTTILIDGSSYTGGATTIPLINAASLTDLNSGGITVMGLEDRGYIVQVNQDVNTGDVTLVISLQPAQTWTGNAVADNLWVTPGNWSLGTLPGIGSTLTISNGDTIDITSDADFPPMTTISLLSGQLAMGAGAHLDLQSGGTLTVDGGSITRDFSANPGVINFGVDGSSSALGVSSGSIQLLNGSASDESHLYSDTTISGGDIDLIGKTKIYNGFTITGSDASIDFSRLTILAGATIHFELDEAGVSPINASTWANIADAQISIDGSSYTGGAATIPLFDTAKITALSTHPFIVTGLEDRGYTVQVNQSLDTDDVNLEIGFATTDTDGDGMVGLMEFAFGTDPNVNDAGALTVNGSSFTPGTPDVEVKFGPLEVKARFIRRIDHASVGITYTAQFSHDLITWEDLDGSTAVRITGTSESGDYEAVELSYPVFLSNGRKAQFYRVQID